MISNKKKIKVDSNLNLKSKKWSFSGDVAKKFSSHVEKSVPLYNEGHNLICNLSDFFLHDNSNFLDIGCSNGQLINKLGKYQNNNKIKYLGVDIEKNMIKEAKKNTSINKKFIQADISNHNFKKQKFDMIISYYTIQFIKPKDRQNLIDKIYSLLNWGGAFIIFEKVRGNDARFQDILTGLYNDFKEQNGLDEIEIYNKSKSLRGVLEPFSSNANMEMLQRSDFKDIFTISKFICFEGLLCIK